MGAGVAEHFSNLAPELVEFLVNIAATSPYLRRLIEHETQWLNDVLYSDPEKAFAQIITKTHGAEIRALRRAKGRVALLIALADIGGMWGLEEVTKALTCFGERVVDEILTMLMQAEISACSFGKSSAEIKPDMAGLFVIAMGKMGAYELNYSSDIDLVLFFDPSRFSECDNLMLREIFLPIARKMAAILGKITPEGYIFRTDLRLRPNPSVTAIVISTNAAEQYYESEGRNWERAAFIKARIIAGDKACGNAFLERLSPFIWRKYLDFATIESTHEIRQSIRTSRDQSTLCDLKGFDIKLGPGGIREIEFFVQTRQLIFGGRDKNLRVRGTCEALDALVEAGHLDSEYADMLQQNYRFLRMIEHRLQMLYDAQTHSLPQSAEGFAQLACLCSMDVDALKTELFARLSCVDEYIEKFFSRSKPTVYKAISSKHAEIMERWNSYPALRSKSTREVFARIAPEIFKLLDKSAASDEAHGNFDLFMRTLPPAMQVFSLFEANPKLIELVVEICAIAPSLADYLARHYAVFDAVVIGDIFGKWPDYSTLHADLEAQLIAVKDYETALDVVRVWQRDWHFRIGLNLLKGYISTQDAARYYSDLAKTVLNLLWPFVRAYSDAKISSPIPSVEFVILGMGSLGRGAINPYSDLDLILLYRSSSDSACADDLRQYASRLTRALIAALSAPTSEGRLYEVDMRLRPSGTKGPIAVSWQAYQHYHEHEAWFWEHLALCSTQAVAGDKLFCTDFEQYRRHLLGRSHVRKDILGKMHDMRVRILQEKAHFDPENPKQGAGGMRDIIYAAQLATFLGHSAKTDIEGQIQTGVEIALWNTKEAETLTEVFALYQGILHVAHLTERGWRDRSQNGLYLRVTSSQTQDALNRKLLKAQKRVQNIIESVFIDSAQ